MFNIIETYTLACPIFKISQFIIDKPSNIIYNSFIFNILHIYKYQGERTQGEQVIGRMDLEPCLPDPSKESFSFIHRLI
jgi:hypothetical protein